MKKTWKKNLSRVLSALMALALLASVGAMALAADSPITLALHYHRPDGDYADWDVWAWGEEGTPMEGIGVPFTEADGDSMVAYIPVPLGTTKVGYIVRKGGGNWTAKDISDDQYVYFPDVLSGTLHLYVESGVPDGELVDGEDLVRGILVTEARYDPDANVINISMSANLTQETDGAFTVTGPGGQVAVTSVSQTADKKYALTPAETLDLTESYTLTYDGMETKINMPNIFSTEGFEAQYTYTGDDLGATWTAEKTTFRVWAPTAKAVSVKLYAGGTEGVDDLIEKLPMTQDVNGTWVAEKSGDLNGTYYTYEVEVGGAVNEAVDPYARTTGVNGRRAMVIDLDSTDPEGWAEDKNPNADLGYTDAIIYELHVRDLSTDASSGIQNVGKFLGLIETGTKTPGGKATGIDHIKELGVTHVHLLPSYDYGSVDETRLDEPQFNWGYDPVNYNVPEGSYSTDPYNGAVRVREMKQMVKGMHDNGLSVIMDVVYNHVQDANKFCFNLIVPGYFSRENSNGSGCGNDTASERSMVSKYIVDSVNYWADEYHIDGFRFDLVGLLDVDTINALVETVHAKHPDVIFYGEGWTMDTAVTMDNVSLATQPNAYLTPGFAYFNDTIRDGIKGGVFDKLPGFVSGASGETAKIMSGFKGKPSWAPNPTQSVNYASCHDNNTLMDRLALSRPDASREDLIRMNNLAAAIYMTSQGIPFMQAGEEMLRTKPNADGTLNENSYNASDEVNSIKWSTLDDPEYAKVFEYYKGLIAFRKAHPILRLSSADDVNSAVKMVGGLPSNVLAFEIAGGLNGETAQGLYVIFNATTQTQTVSLPAGYTWNVYVNGEKAGTEVLGTVSGEAEVAPISAMVLVRGAQGDSSNKGLSGGAVAAIAAVSAGVLAGVGVVLTKNRSKKNKK